MRPTVSKHIYVFPQSMKQIYVLLKNVIKKNNKKKIQRHEILKTDKFDPSHSITWNP